MLQEQGRSCFYPPGTMGLVADGVTQRNDLLSEEMATALASRDLGSGPKLTQVQLAEAGRLYEGKDKQETGAYQVSFAFATLARAHARGAAITEGTHAIPRAFLEAYRNQDPQGPTQLGLGPASKIYARAAQLVGARAARLQGVP